MEIFYSIYLKNILNNIWFLQRIYLCFEEDCYEWYKILDLNKTFFKRKTVIRWSSAIFMPDFLIDSDRLTLKIAKPELSYYWRGVVQLHMLSMVASYRNEVVFLIDGIRQNIFCVFYNLQISYIYISIFCNKLWCYNIHCIQVIKVLTTTYNDTFVVFHNNRCWDCCWSCPCFC